MEGIAMYPIYGFLESGKTTYIQDSILHGFFHRRGSTLVLCFEQGETAYDEERLRGYRTAVAYWDGGEDVAAFCCEAIRRCQPDRVYVEMNAMLPGLREKLPDELRIVVSEMMIDGGTLPLYARNMRQLLQDMVKASNQVTINHCDKSALKPSGQLFRLMNPKAIYLWQGEGGYHERAFEDFVPFDLDADTIELGEADFIPFALDAASHPEHYDGKTLTLEAQVAVDGTGRKVGRLVMTCCMSDLQFMGVACTGMEEMDCPAGSWVRLTARGEVARDGYGRRLLVLRTLAANRIRPPENALLKG